MTNKTFPGNDLRDKRESLDLTVEDIYRRLRIPPHIIRALESGSVNELPPSTFAAGFLKSYCGLLGLDGEGYAAALQEATRQPTGLKSIAEKSPAERPAWFNDAVAWAAIIAMLAIGWATYTVMVQPDASEGDGRVQAETFLFDDEQ